MQRLSCAQNPHLQRWDRNADHFRHFFIASPFDMLEKECLPLGEGERGQRSLDRGSELVLLEAEYRVGFGSRRRGVFA